MINKWFSFKCVCAHCGVELNGQFLNSELFVDTQHSCTLPYEKAAQENKEAQTQTGNSAMEKLPALVNELYEITRNINYGDRVRAISSELLELLQ